ncbi:MAG: SMP-30/gluconolactonase/LRE family protein [Acidobacteriaceae bacterium]|nr:SMP-30/gluconolactonase/LRE family protein [Acidobacteriaceae bacterium]MBV8569334.1 SMP-30/gluconolactonase/LRE family protein [Acidobacteriaceae bacterium]
MGHRYEIECIVPAGDRCGEGPVWHAAEQALYWTDINRFLIHRLDFRDGSVKSWFFDQPVTALVLTDREHTLAVALGSRVIFWEPATDERRDQGFALAGWPQVRFNDGRADPRGSLWLGSMRNNVNPDGSCGEVGGTDGVLYRIDTNGSVTEWKRDIAISNTLAWNADRNRFYFADSLADRIWSYRYDEQTGDIANECVFFEGFNRGLPDGSNIDREGFLWNCRYGGKCIIRIAPDGVIDRIIEMPVSNVTSCTFGGPDLRILYITTASNGAPAGERLSGGLFALRTDVPGLPENCFRVFG